MIPKPVSPLKLAELKLNSSDVWDEQSPIEEWQSENRQKVAFLDAYRLCLSPTIACNRAGVSKRKYDEWRKSSYEFAVRLNAIIEDAKDELFGSVLVRATGYLREDDKGNIEVDAVGKPIYYGASDPLAIALLKSVDDKDEEDKPKGIVINLTPKKIVEEEGE